MLTRILLACALIVGCSTLRAQVDNSWYVGVSLEVGMPLGDFHSLNGIGFGGMLRAGYLTGGHVLLTAGTGYMNFGSGLKISGLEGSLPSPTTSVIPILVGVRYLSGSNDDIRPFLGGEAGLYFGRMQVDIFGLATAEATTVRFGAAPLAGARFRSTQTAAVDLLAKYSIIALDGSPSWLSLEGGGAFATK